MTLRRGQIAAVLIVGIIGVLLPGMQPQLLGALAAEGRLSVASLGTLASVELFAMGFAAGGAGFVLAIDRLRLIAMAALLVSGVADLLTPIAVAGEIFVARTIAGLAEGVLIWIAIGFITRTERPERWSGIYLGSQTLCQLALASVVGLYATGVVGGFTALGIVTLGGIAVVWSLPAAYAPLATDHVRAGQPSTRGLAALIGVLFYLAFIVAIWVFVEPLALQHGLAAETVHLIAPLSLAMQVLGAGAATLLAGRLPALPTVMLVGAINFALLAIMAAPPSAGWFVAASAIFGFLWLFVLPFQVPVVIAADPSRRAALLIGGAQLVGSSVGPLCAGLVVSEADVVPVLWFGALCLIVAITMLVVVASVRHSAPR